MTEPTYLDELNNDINTFQAHLNSGDNGGVIEIAVVQRVLDAAKAHYDAMAVALTRAAPPIEQPTIEDDTNGTN